MRSDQEPSHQSQKNTSIHLSGRQKVLYESLVTRDQESARMYLGSLQVLNSDNINKLAFAAHGIRELLEKLPIYVAQEQPKVKPPLKAKVKEKTDDWDRVVRNSKCHRDGDWSGQIDAPLSKFLRRMQEFFVWVAQDLPGRKSEATEVLYAMDASKHRIPELLQKDNVDSWFKLRDFFINTSHHRHHPTTADFESHLGALEQFLLERLRPRTFEDAEAIDSLIAAGEKIIDQKIIDDSIELARKGYSQYEYFFSKLNSAAWVLPLRNKEFFKNPPTTELQGDNEYWSPWPESRYLARVANLDPNAVVSAFQSMPKIDNPLVHADIVEAALKIPSDQAAVLSSIERSWIEDKTYLSTFTHDYGKLIAHLAEGGEVDEALEYARVLLDFVHVPQIAEGTPESEEREPRRSLRLKPRLLHWYDTVLQDNMAALVSAAGIDAVKLLVGLLDKFLRLSCSYADSEQPHDHFISRLPSLVDTDSARDRDAETHLALALLNAIEQVISKAPSELPGCINILRARKWPIFSRMALHILASNPDSAMEQVRDCALSQKFFHNDGVNTEYFHLLKSMLDKLSDEDKTIVFARIQDGPNWIPNRFKEERVEQVRFINNWKCRRYHVCRAHIFGDFEAEYRQLYEEFGVEGTAPFRRPSKTCATWSGPLSPCTPEELCDRTDPEIVHYISSWEPKSGLKEPTIEGLARTLRTAVEKDSRRFSHMADLLIPIDPTYVRALLEGLKTAIKEEPDIAWAAVLKLALWAVENHGNDIDTDDYVGDRDPGWNWTRKSIASLLDAGLNPCESEIPFGHRGDVWRILDTLCEASEPTPEYEAKYGGTNMDPITLSLNVVRGQAISGAIGYALWVKRHLLNGKEENDHPLNWIEQMPEVISVLERHLDPNEDPSPAIRSNYGRYFPQLAWLDENWAGSQVESIFGADRKSPLEHSAWAAFLYFCQPGTTMLDMLAPVYSRAVEHIAPITSEDTGEFDDAVTLAQHLVTYFAWGALEERNLDNLLSSFFNRANDRLRGEAIEHAGKFSKNCPDREQPKLRARLVELWVVRRNEIESGADPSRHSQEVSAFGSWFVSDLFEEDWAVEQLVWVLRNTMKVDSAYLVVKRLADCSKRNLPSALVCLKAMIEGDKEGWEVSMWRDDIIRLLEKCLLSESAELEERARNLVHWLGARGYSEFRSLVGQAKP